MVDKKIPRNRVLTSVPSVHPVNDLLDRVHAILRVIINNSLISCAEVGQHASLDQWIIVEDVVEGIVGVEYELHVAAEHQSEMINNTCHASQ